MEAKMAQQMKPSVVEKVDPVWSRIRQEAEEVATINVPVLVAVGGKDPIAGAPQPLASLLPKGRALEIPNRDHMLAVGDKVFKAAVIEFLNDRP